jgi:hypothetical protein
VDDHDDDHLGQNEVAVHWLVHRVMGALACVGLFALVLWTIAWLGLAK